MNKLFCIVTFVAVAAAGSRAFADNNEGPRREEVEKKFSGGHVLFGPQSVDPITAANAAMVHAPDILRWAVEHKGVHIGRGDLVQGTFAIDNWRYIGPRRWGKRVSLPKTYVGYVGWKP